MRHEDKSRKCRHSKVRKLVDVLVLLGKSNREENYNILLHERVIEDVGGNVFLREPVVYELVGLGNGMIKPING